jgi:hypothetical protein
MSLEKIILIGSWIAIPLILIFFVPKNKRQDASVSFFFFQSIVWIVDLLIVYFHLVAYPIREFPYATQVNLTFHYLLYPTMAVFFTLYYPLEKSYIQRIMYSILSAAAVTLFAEIIKNYTRLTDYINWSWYLSFLVLFVQFYLTEKFYLWIKRDFKESIAEPPIENNRGKQKI